MKKIKLDKEERALEASFARGEWKAVPNVRHEIARHRRYAKNTLRKDKRVNIRISSKDLDELQTIALQEGIPYQTLMGSILHRYAAGRLSDRRVRGYRIF
ncbi:MAG: antitoxin [Elusimicrobia bacterium]|nr:antitoxin [Elusimicrobiota bacterium]